jgi:D-alanyl-D-alanine dipeptidase
MAELSGPHWCERFPTSREISVLTVPFRDKVAKFVGALRAGNATVSIHATLRPKQRAYLMHYAYLIAKRQCTPGAVPPLHGVDIQWVHPNAAESIAAAARMVAEYAIVYEPALQSRHTQGLAIDMDITWDGDLAIKSASGGNIAIQTAPRTGMNPALWTLGAAYGVHKLAADAPHWSSDGH